MNFSQEGFDKKVINNFFDIYEIPGFSKSRFENIISNDFILKYFPTKNHLQKFPKGKFNKGDIKLALNFLIRVGIIHRGGLIEYIDMFSGKKTGRFIVKMLLDLGYIQKAKVRSIFKDGNNDEMILVMPSNIFLKKTGLTIKGINHLFIKHTMITNYILLKGLIKAKLKNSVVNYYQSENTLKNDKYTQHLFSDGYLELSSNKNTKNKIIFYYEIDNGSEPILALLSKLIRYKRFCEDIYKIREKNKKSNTFVKGEKIKNIIIFTFSSIKRIKEFKKAVDNNEFIKKGFNGNIYAGLHQHYFKNPYFSNIKIL